MRTSRRSDLGCLVRASYTLLGPNIIKAHRVAGVDIGLAMCYVRSAKVKARAGAWRGFETKLIGVWRMGTKMI